MRREVEGLSLEELPRRELAAALRREVVAAADLLSRLGLALVPQRVRFATGLADGRRETAETIEFEISFASGGREAAEPNLGRIAAKEAGNGR